MVHGMAKGLIREGDTMLGEQLAEEIGQTTATRVLPSEGAPRVEVSFQSSRTILGFPPHRHGTYLAVPRPDGTFLGKARV